MAACTCLRLRIMSITLRVEECEIILCLVKYSVEILRYPTYIVSRYLSMLLTAISSTKSFVNSPYNRRPC